MALGSKAEAKRLWQETRLTQAQIGEKVQRSASTIGRWGNTEHWGPRPGDVGKAPREPNFSRRRANRSIAKRMHNIIIRKLDLMEKGLEDGTLSVEEAERHSKSISSMVGGYGKVNEAPHAEKKRKRSKADVIIDDVARLQLEIIERFERIQRRREAARGSE